MSMNSEEFKAKIEPLYRIMYRVAMSALRNEDEAADAVHDTVLKLFDRRNQLENISNFKSYCLCALRNICLNIKRNRKVSLEITEVKEIHSDYTPYDIIYYNDLSNKVKTVLEQLPVNQKKVFQLSAFGGFSNSEIAEMLGVTQGSVRMILSRVRKKIKESI